MRLLHLSFNDNLPSTLYPRQPAGYIKPQGEPGLYYENLPERISFAPTIQQCFNAIYFNIKHLFEYSKKYNSSIKMFVYEGISDSNTTFISKDILKTELWDYHITEEIAVTSPITIKKIAEILVFNPFDEEGNIDSSREIYGYAFADLCNELRFIAPKITYEYIF